MSYCKRDPRRLERRSTRKNTRRHEGPSRPRVHLSRRASLRSPGSGARATSVPDRPPGRAARWARPIDHRGRAGRGRDLRAGLGLVVTMRAMRTRISLGLTSAIRSPATDHDLTSCRWPLDATIRVLREPIFFACVHRTVARPRPPTEARAPIVRERLLDLRHAPVARAAPTPVRRNPRRVVDAVIAVGAPSSSAPSTPGNPVSLSVCSHAWLIAVRQRVADLVALRPVHDV